MKIQKVYSKMEQLLKDTIFTFKKHYNILFTVSSSVIQKFEYIESSAASSMGATIVLHKNHYIQKAESFHIMESTVSMTKVLTYSVPLAAAEF